MVHPHACGEHGSGNSLKIPSHGSPPRMWGTPGRQKLWCMPHRFTPTHVGNTIHFAMKNELYQVHPHACGEHVSAIGVLSASAGSPPRMWGTRTVLLSYDKSTRFTPTHVGNTHLLHLKRQEYTVHPHACGEHRIQRVSTISTNGSPPRMWGTPGVETDCIPRKRFTPTHVGNTLDGYLYFGWHPVHPHACGEHASHSATNTTTGGSPPRMWGTQNQKLLMLFGMRFTPTHVGNTSNGRPLFWRIPVHPHACGEHNHQPIKYALKHGSPPRMWGTRKPGGTDSNSTRFTPTHVGNTRPASPGDPATSVHPHACGEHVQSCCSMQSCFGSPPRMWGTRSRQTAGRRCGRFTPTHVGNTAPCVCLCLLLTVHPHACGEHQVRPGQFDPERGSPPRMWGTRRKTMSRSPCSRFTPTHVGNTTSCRLAAKGQPVHPHACGEHCPPLLHPSGVLGSPPRMWGTPNTSQQETQNEPVHPHACGEHAGHPAGLDVVSRFTPTHVGNTCCLPNQYRARTVHPHACGEHRCLGLALPLRRGSPPRMWGTHCGLDIGHQVFRFTPTHVGNTLFL